MDFSDIEYEWIGPQRVPGEEGLALIGDGALADMERLFGCPLEVGQARYLTWEPGAPTVLVVVMSPTRIEVRLPAGEPSATLTRLIKRLGALARGSFGERLANAIARVEAWNESDAEPATDPEELAAELTRLRQLAPSVESAQAILDAIEALDDGLPADAVAAALYRAQPRPS
jgi:hypothetical protein